MQSIVDNASTPTSTINDADFPRDRLPEPKQIPRNRFIVHRHMQIAASDADVAVPCSIPDFGQRSPAGQRVADKRVAPVVDADHSKYPAIAKAT